MDYITAGEAAAKWGVSPRAVVYQLAAGRIPGACKKGKLWLIPAAAERPADLRRRTIKPAPLSLEEDLAAVIAATGGPMPADNPDAILSTLSEDRLRLQYEGDLAYLRGNFVQTLRCFERTAGDDAARLRVCPIAVAAAISLGDYDTYSQIEDYLNKKAAAGGSVAAVAQLALATAAVSVIAPNLVPEWLKSGDFDALPLLTKPNAFSLRAKYFLCVGQYDAMLVTAQTALALSVVPSAFTTTDLYLRLVCANAYRYLGRDEEAIHHLLSAMRLALPHGFITPFAELVTAQGGLIERCLQQEFPAYYDAVLGQWAQTWKNWVGFHNRFTRDNITLMLTLREYHIAFQVARRVPYATIARQQGISVGRLKNIMQDIYEKLFISGRSELAELVF